MITSNKAVTICDGMATITVSGTASPLCVSESSLLKYVSEDTFFIDVTPRTIEFVTGKKTVYNKGAEGKTETVKPKLTTAETIICVLYEYAYDVFKTGSGIEIKVSFSNGTELEWK